jgi:ATP-dependent Lon protease
MGADDDDALDELKKRLDAAGLSEEAGKVATKELKRLHTIQPSSPEYTVARTYLEWLADLPWSTDSQDNLNIPHARGVLDERHTGLEKIKKRVLEYLAVRKLKSDMRGPILCLVGPPGVGKTSLGQAIADALSRQFVRISLGGVRDEAEIRGHRRTYIGALPGKIIQSLKKAETRNPVFMLDEVDKLGRDWRGDPTSALLEVLDPEQNGTFVDHYLDVQFDLSHVLFIATANVTDTIPAPLLDRMDVLELPGYTHEEKLAIARDHLVPKQLGEHGIGTDHLTFGEDVVDVVINRYTREAGVRNLERRVGDICRAVAVQVAENGLEHIEVQTKDIEKYLGPTRFERETAEEHEVPGVATGLAWNAAGGDILFIEVSRMPGKGELRITGQLGDVMKESCEIARSFVRAHGTDYGLQPDVFERSDIHIHVPAGATPKDGPSAGVTMFTALVSLLTGIPVRHDVAMTGEITLRGRVLPVGGIKDKVLAAQRGRIAKVILPEKNRKDLPDIPESVRESIEIVFVETMDEVLAHALLDPDSVTEPVHFRSEANMV